MKPEAIGWMILCGWFGYSLYRLIEQIVRHFKRLKGKVASKAGLYASNTPTKMRFVELRGGGRTDGKRIVLVDPGEIVKIPFMPVNTLEQLHPKMKVAEYGGILKKFKYIETHVYPFMSEEDRNLFLQVAPRMGLPYDQAAAIANHGPEVLVYEYVGDE